MKYEDFNDFFSNLDVNKNEINSKWKELSARKRKKTLVTFIVILIIDGLILYKIKFLSIFVIGTILILDVYILIISLVIFKDKDVDRFDKEYKENVINKMLENFIDDLDYIPLKSLPRNIYDEAKYGEDYNRYSSDDYFEGKINGQEIVMADLLVQKATTKINKDGKPETETKTIFNGLFGKINLGKSIDSNLIINNNRGFEFVSESKIEMDSYEFEKNFNVYSNNNIVCMQLLTVDIQEEFLELYNKYNIDFNISIMQDNLYVLFETGSMFEVFSTKNNPNEVLEKYFNIMKFIYKLIEKIIKTINNTQI